MHPGFSEMAQARIDDDIFRAQAYRQSRETRKAATAAGRSRVRALIQTVATLIMPGTHGGPVFSNT
jgi:hypothetical protein